MKRKPLDPKERKIYGINITKPWFFWKKCCECGYEYRRESIIRIDVMWYEKLLSKNFGAVCRSDGRSIDTYFYCFNCCKSISEAEDKFIKEYLPLYRGY